MKTPPCNPFQISLYGKCRDVHDPWIAHDASSRLTSDLPRIAVIQFPIPRLKPISRHQRSIEIERFRAGIPHK